MSVDERIRTALHHEMPTWTAAPDAYAAVVRGARRRRQWRIGLAAGVIAIAAAGGVAVGQPWQDERAVPAVPSPPAEDRVVIPSPQSTTHELEGKWAAPGWVDWSQLAGTVKDAGLGQWVDELHTELPADRMKLRLRFVDGYLIYTGIESDGGSRGAVDYRLARLEGDRMILAFDTGRPGETVFRWKVFEDTLSFRFLSTTEGTRASMPGEVYQRALYTSVPFHRVG